MVPEVDIRRDPRFTLEEQWFNSVVPSIVEGAERGSGTCAFNSIWRRWPHSRMVVAWLETPTRYSFI